MINRHNYEEFFLMYVDNELNAEQRAAVEVFVRQNPDLAEELDMLNQAKLPIMEDEFSFDKDILLKNDDAIGMDNYEEYFLLYIDNELSLDKREAVEKFVLQHPQLQDAFTLLKQTVLEKEAIVFEDKDSLLRKEERRIIPLFIRIAVAAAVLGIIALVWWFKAGTTQNAVNNIAVNKQQEQKKNEAVITVPGKTKEQPEVAQQQEQKTQTQEPLVKQPEVNRNKDLATTTNRNEINKKKVIKQPEENNHSDIAITNTQSNNTEHNAPVTNSNSVPQNVNNHDPVVADNNPQRDNANTRVTEEQNIPGTDLTNAKNNLAYQDNNLVKPAVYKELNTDEDDNQRTVYVGSLELNKNKVRGFMKKVGGLFAGKTKD